MTGRSTGQVAELLGVPLHRLDYLTRDRQVRPKKGPTGAFMWDFEEIRLAAHLMGLSPPTDDKLLQGSKGVSLAEEPTHVH